MGKAGKKAKRRAAMADERAYQTWSTARTWRRDWEAEEEAAAAAAPVVVGCVCALRAGRVVLRLAVGRSLSSARPPPLAPRQSSAAAAGGDDIFGMDDMEELDAGAHAVEWPRRGQAEEGGEEEGREEEEEEEEGRAEGRAEEEEGERRELRWQQAQEEGACSRPVCVPHGAAGGCGEARRRREVSDAHKIAMGRATELQMSSSPSSFSPARSLEAWPALPPSPLSSSLSQGASPVTSFALGEPAAAPLDAEAEEMQEAKELACALAAIEAAEAGGARGEAEEEGVLCAICHGSIQPQEAALVRGCDHAFCNGCILNWAMQKPKCPLCQLQFTHLWLYKQLDGTYNDFLVEQNVEVLLCATWFRKQVVPEFTPQPAEYEEEEEYLEMLQYMYGGAREVEEANQYYEDLARRTRGSRPRAVGNRTFGSGGVMATGRRAARATPNGGPSRASAAGSPPDSGPAAARSPSASALKKAEKLAVKESQKMARREAALAGGKGKSV